MTSLSRRVFTFISILLLVIATSIQTIAVAQYPDWYEPVMATTNTRLNGDLVEGGVVRSFSISPNSQRVVYLADQDADEKFELYSVPIDRSHEPVRLTVTPEGGREARQYFISPDSQRVVFRAYWEVPGSFELYSVPIDGSSAPVKLNGALVSGGEVFEFKFSPDGTRVIYTAEQEVEGRYDLYSVRTDGSSAPVRLSASLTGGGNVFGVMISPLGTHVVYRQESNGLYDLYSVPLSGGTPVKLNADLANDDIHSFRLSPDNTRVIYMVDQEVAGRGELYTVPLSGGTRVKISGNVTGTGGVRNFEISPDSARVVFRAKLAGDNRDELYSASRDGSSAPVKLTGNIPSGIEMTHYSKISPDGTRLVFVVTPEPNKYELYSVPLDASSAPFRLQGALDLGGGSEDFWFAISADSTRVVFEAAPSTGDRQSLYSVPLDASSAPVKLSGNLLPRHTVYDSFDYQIRPDNKYVVYMAYQVASGPFELYRAPLNGSGEPDKLNAELVTGGNVRRFAISPNSARVVYLADQDIDNVYEIYTEVPLRVIPPYRDWRWSGRLPRGHSWEPPREDVPGRLPEIPCRLPGTPGCPDGGSAFYAPFETEAPLYLQHTETALSQFEYVVAHGGNIDVAAKALTRAIHNVPIGTYFSNKMKQQLVAAIDKTVKQCRQGRIAFGPALDARLGAILKHEAKAGEDKPAVIDPKTKKEVLQAVNAAKHKWRLAEFAPGELLASPVLTGSFNAMALDWRIPRTQPRVTRTRVKKGKYVGANLGSLAWGGLRDVTRSGRLTLEIKTGYEAFPVGAKYSPSWPHSTYVVGFDGRLGPAGYLELTFDVNPVRFQQRIKDVRVLQVRKEGLVDVTMGSDQHRGTVTARTKHPGAFVIVGRK